MKLFNVKESEKLNFNTMIVDRKYEKLEVENAINDVKMKKKDFKVISIHGDKGVGKTRLLKEIKRTLELSDVRIIDNLDIKDGFNYQEERLNFIIKLGELLENYSGKETIAVLIDDIQFKYASVVEVLSKVMRGNVENVTVILSYRDSDSKQGMRMCMENAINKDLYSDITLRPLNELHCEEMVKNILGISHPIPEFSKLIYEKSMGNPMLVEEIIKSLYLLKQIYIDKESGEWFSDYEISDLCISSNLVQLIINQALNMDITSKRICSLISAFQNSISSRDIVDILGEEEKTVEYTIKHLKDKGILVKNENTIEFHNKAMKEIIFNNLSEDRKKILQDKITSLVKKNIEHSLARVNSEVNLAIV